MVHLGLMLDSHHLSRVCLRGNLRSLVIEYADDGDLFQKITFHQKDGTYFLERDVWKIFI